MKFLSAGLTNPGMKRELNEDNFLILKDEGVFVVADGMGGHNAGEVASKIAVDTIAEFFHAAREDEDVTWPYKLDPTLSFDANKLMVCVKFANRRIFKCSILTPEYSGMGTTIVSILAFDGQDELYVAHVGDSRCYCLHDGQLSQVTEDHSLVNEYIKAGQITKEQAKTFPNKNVIMRALGMKDNVLIDIQKRPACAGDIYLLCSDGLSDMVPDNDLEALMRQDIPLDEICQQLIDLANSNGGKDNITAVLVKVTE